MKNKLNIALVGNPNSGKSSLFNALTGLRQKVGNFPGITVEKKTGTVRLHKDLRARIIDLPGSYSIYPKAETEKVTTRYLLQESPDLVVLVADASNLKRNLLYTTQIIDLGIPIILALNMVDVAQAKGYQTDTGKLSEELGIPVMEINARKSEGIEMLKEEIASFQTREMSEFVDIRSLAPKAIDGVKDIMGINSNYAAFLLSVRAKEDLTWPAEERHQVLSLLKEQGFNEGQMVGKETLLRYEKIKSLAGKTTVHKAPDATGVSDRIDNILTHKIYGYIIFLATFFLVFQAIFSWAEYPMQLIEEGFGALGEWLMKVMPHGFLTSLLVEGVLAGIGGIAIFIPQIAILFGFITVMEETGYMSRVSFLMDRIMRKVGLNGKSVVPLMSGFACAIPAIMATRNIENWKERLITILITPFMSCSARLPVYTILIGLVIPDETILGIFNLKGITFMGLYLAGILAALITAVVLQALLKIKEQAFFIMELPIYQPPRWKNVLVTMYEKARIFTLEAGRVILVISVVLWLLASFGPGETMNDIRAKYDAIEAAAPLADEMVKQKQSELITASYAGVMGKYIEPVIAPLGFDWKIGLALVTSFAAREVFVGTMATIYSVGGSDNEFHSVREHMLAEVNTTTGGPFYTLAVGLSLMIFYAFAMQCMSTLAVVRRETQSWKWPIVQLLYMTGFAYVASMLVYQILK